MKPLVLSGGSGTRLPRCGHDVTSWPRAYNRRRRKGGGSRALGTSAGRGAQVPLRDTGTRWVPPGDHRDKAVRGGARRGGQGGTYRQLFAGNLAQHPADNDTPYRVVGDLTNSDVVTEQTFWAGVYPALTEEMLDYVVSSVRSFVDEHG